MSIDNLAQLRGRIAITTRHWGADDPRVLADRAELRTLRAVAFVRDMVAGSPLTAEQRRRIVAAVGDVTTGEPVISSTGREPTP